MHYRRWSLYGDPLKVKTVYTQGTAEKRFWAKVEVTPYFWFWRAYKDSNGYGHFSDIPGNRKLAHRIAYEYLVGEIPEGLVLDHMCHTPKCVNPSHLTAVTVQENSENSSASDKRSGFRGVHRYKAGGDKRYWAARVTHKHQKYFLGYYPKFELHVAAYRSREVRNDVMTNNLLDRR